VTDAIDAKDAEPDLSGEVRTRAPGQPLMKRYLPVLIAAVAGLVIGAGITSAFLAPPMAEATAHVEQLESQLDRSESDLSNAKSFNKELLSAAEEVEKAAEELAAREAAVQGREDAVTVTEQTIAANSFGPGMYVVGVDVSAGVYRNDGATDCYYAWMTTSGSDADIVDNEITDGPATVTLRDGENFKSDRCGTWTKIG
jgi:hypothetical protein